MKYRFFAAIAVAAGVAGCPTVQNPDVCCTTEASCAQLGIPPTGCADGFVCTDFACVPAKCASDTECTAAAPVCNLTTATCGGCSSADDCTSYPDAPVCDPGGACRGCQLDAECPSEVCDLDSGRCVAESDVIYAAPAGTDTAACTHANPCSTSRAVVVASADPSLSIVRMLPGTYASPISITSGTVLVVANGALLRSATLYAINVRDSANVEIRGIDIAYLITQIVGSGSQYPFLTMTDSHILSTMIVEHGTLKLHRCVVSDTTGTPVSIRDDGTLEAERVHFKGVFSSGQVVNAIGKRIRLQITNSLFDNIAIHLNTFDVAPEQSEFRVGFSTFVLPDDFPQECGRADGYPRLVSFENNIFYSPGGTTDVIFRFGFCSMVGNIMYPQALGPGGGDNRAIDPKLVDVAARDFRLAADSPAIDAAVNSALPYVDHDFAGNPRPQGARKDIGAFERAP